MLARYSEKAELLQNAEDNSYNAGARPSVAFVLSASAVHVLNNERGFTADDVRALCDVGSSTKKVGSRRLYFIFCYVF